MQKMTVMALPESVIDAMNGQQRLAEHPQGRWNFSAMRRLALYRGDAFFYCIAFFLGRLVFLGDLAPFGLGFFAAAAQAEQRRMTGVGMAVLLGVLSTGRYEEIGIYLFAMCAYAKLRHRFTKLDRQMFAVPFVMFFSVLIGGFFVHFLKDAALYAYLTSSFNALLCLLSSGLFLYGMPLLQDRHAVVRAYRQAASEPLICLIVILALAIAGIGNLAFFGYQVQSVLGSILVMALALAGGAGLGAAVGVVVGMVTGLGGSGQALQSIALYAVGGTVAGVFRLQGKFAVILGFIFGTLMMHLSFTQIPLLMDAVMEVVLAAGILLFLPVAATLELAREPVEMALASSRRALEESGAKLQYAADLFYELGALLGMRRGKEETVDQLDLARLFSAVGVKVCEQCPNRPSCWEENYYRTYQHLLTVFHHLGEKPLQGKDLSLEFREDCMQAGRIVEVVNELMEKNRIHTYWREKLESQKDMLSDQMKATGNIVAQLALEMEKSSPFDGKFEQTLRRKAAQIGCQLGDVKVIGKDRPRRIEIEKAACGKSGECVNSLMPLATGVVRERLTMTRKCGNADLQIPCKICLRAAPQFRVKAAFASVPKNGKVLCGDSLKVTPLYDGKVSLLLSDGMGSGENAATESRLTVGYLDKLLQQNFDVDAAVKMVNSLLLLEASGEQRFATVDMAIVDQYTGEAEFLKIACAPSFIKRVREVKEIHAKALPVGILHQIEIRPVKAQLVANDVLIMVSDGIADLREVKVRSGDKEGWLVNFIRRNEVADERKFAEAILAEAVRISGGQPKDDMSILVMRLGSDAQLDR